MLITDHNDPSCKATFYFHEGSLYIRTTNGEQVEATPKDVERLMLFLKRNGYA